jgi:hypothetical protein
LKNIFLNHGNYKKKSHIHLATSPTTRLLSLRIMDTATPHFIKLNFDGAFKCNHGPLVVGNMFKDNKGNIQCIYSCHLGHNTNNGVDLIAMVRGMQIVIHQGFNNVVLEGDSQIMIL